MAGSSKVSGYGAEWQRPRKRWIAVGLLGATWLGYALISGSVIGSTLLFLTLALLAGALYGLMRAFGIDGDHPLVRPLRTRPWRDGREVFKLALRNLPTVFIITPHGSRIAPSAVEILMNLADVDSLVDFIDLELASTLALEAYEMEIAKYSARTSRKMPLDVKVLVDPDIPAGRYLIRQHRAAASPALAGQSSFRARDGYTLLDPSPEERDFSAEETDLEPQPNPLLRLVTGDSVAETRKSGARAGRGRAADLMLPNQDTISREHAEFRCAEGRWYVANLGRNGVLVNGSPISGEREIGDGDSISWGRRPDAIASKVEIR